MDSITQALLGASLAGAVAGKTLGRSALLTGALLGTLPDMDVVIDYGSAVANFTQHRGFSHSLFILAPLAVVLAWGLARWKPQMSFRRWLALTGLVLLTHPVLDSFTTYGTQLFWPFGRPVAISSIFIIDPLYTLPLLAGCLAFLFRPPARSALAAGLVLSTLYLSWTVLAQHLITERVRPALAEAGLEHSELLVQPMPFNTILWRATALSDARHIEIVTGFLDGETPLTLATSPRRLDLARSVSEFPEAQRLEWFSDGFLRYERSGNAIIATDIRLGIPGAHPFTFVLARENNHSVQPVTSTRQPTHAINPNVLSSLWHRLTGDTQALCLTTRLNAGPGLECSP